MANNCYYEMRISGKPSSVQAFLDLIQRKNEIERFNIGAFLSAACYEDLRPISSKYSSVDICGDCKWSVWSTAMNNGGEQGIIGASKNLSLCIEFYSQESEDELAEYGFICCGDVMDYNRVHFWENEILYSIIDSEYRKNDAQLAALSDEDCKKILEAKPIMELIRIYEAATESIVPAYGEYRYEDGYLTVGGFAEEKYYYDEEIVDMLRSHSKSTEPDFIQALFDTNVTPGNWCPPKMWNTVPLDYERVLEFGLYRELDSSYTFQIFNNEDVVLCETVGVESSERTRRNSENPRISEANIKYRKNTINKEKNKMTNKIETMVYEEKVSLIPFVGLYDVADFMGNKLPGLAVSFYDELSEEPYAFLTVSFGEFISIKNASYIDANNVPEAVLKACLEAGIAKQTPLTKHSGYVEYPLWVFDENWLKEIDEKKYAEYSTAYDNYMKGFGES